jgi:hypothetical protein
LSHVHCMWDMVLVASMEIAGMVAPAFLFVSIVG